MEVFEQMEMIPCLEQANPDNKVSVVGLYILFVRERENGERA